MAMFIDRVEEFKHFSNLKKVNIIFGRRRVGKTRFVKELLKDLLPSNKAVYLLAINKDLSVNLKRFSQALALVYNIPGLNFQSFKEMFQFLETRKNTEIIAIDEFGYLIRHGILPEFQEIIDEVVKHKKLILTGSSMSVMENSFLNASSPVYGRVDKILHLQPFKFKHLFEWFKRLRFQDLLKIYSVTGGVPRYLEFFNEQELVEKQVITNFFNQSLLFYDARKLLEEELIEAERYLNILEAISKGKNSLNEIRNHTGIEYQSLPFYLQKLRRLKIIKKQAPILGKKKSIYVVTDPYYMFWFRFVYPFEDEIDSGFNTNAVNDFKKNFNAYLGIIFEQVCKEFLQQGFNFTKIGKWWFKDKEIDIVALNEESKEILFGECKWQGNVNAERIVKELVEKSQFVQWHNAERKERFAVFAKSFKKRLKSFEGKPVYCFDLKDLEKLFKLKKRKV